MKKAKQKIENGSIIEIKTDFEFPKRKRYIMINKNNVNRKDLKESINILKPIYIEIIDTILVV